METTDPLSLTFAALADPTRRAILSRLALGEATVNELAEPFALRLPTVSKHLKVLQRAGLVTQSRKAQWRPCRLEAARLKDVARSETTDPLSLTFAALADPTRRAILSRLALGEATVNELAEPFALRLPTVSKHLKVLQRAGLVTQSRKAQWRPCRLEAARLKDVA